MTWVNEEHSPGHELHAKPVDINGQIAGWDVFCDCTTWATTTTVWLTRFTRATSPEQEFLPGGLIFASDEDAPAWGDGWDLFDQVEQIWKIHTGATAQPTGGVQ